MKRILQILFTLVIKANIAFAQYTIIPDTNFETSLIRQGIDNDGLNGKVLNSRIDTITLLSVSSAGITSLTGIEGFKSLNYLYCGDNQLTTLDVSKNVALTNLTCYVNKLTSLDLSINIALTYLLCPNNKLTSLNVTKNTKLNYLYCPDNQLENIDLSNNTALTTLVCDMNKLMSLDVSKNIALDELSCITNPNLQLICVPNITKANVNFKKDPSSVWSETCVTDVSDMNNNYLFSISPNPSNGNFSFNSLVAGICTVQNTLGEIVGTVAIGQGKNNISLNLAVGIYYVSVGNLKDKIVVE